MFLRNGGVTTQKAVFSIINAMRIPNPTSYEKAEVFTWKKFHILPTFRSNILFPSGSTLKMEAVCSSEVGTNLPDYTVT
jgi:hypothetical protein